MTSPLVTVVVPTYNYGKFIEKTIDCALGQTYSPLQIIVVDDGSTDDTRERVAAYGSRAHYLLQENRGPAAARNRGVQGARGEFVAFLDSDDLWLPDKIERQMAVAVHQPDIGLVATERFAVDEDGHPHDGDAEPHLREGFCELTPRDLLEFGAFSPSSVLVRKDVLSATGGFNEELKGPEDMEMWVRIAARFRVVRLHAALTGQREHPASLSHKADLMLRNHQRAIDSLFAGLPQLRGRHAWRRVAEARMYREVAFMRHSAGDRAGALTDLLRSGCRWPFALRDRQMNRKHLERSRMFLRYGLAKNPAMEGAA